jgi:hypothetical protein
MPTLSEQFQAPGEKSLKEEQSMSLIVMLFALLYVWVVI